MTLNLLTGLLLIVVPLMFNAAFLLLQRAFDYPDILRRPVDEVLRRQRDLAGHGAQASGAAEATGAVEHGRQASAGREGKKGG